MEALRGTELLLLLSYLKVTKQARTSQVFPNKGAAIMNDTQTLRNIGWVSVAGAFGDRDQRYKS